MKVNMKPIGKALKEFGVQHGHEVLIGFGIAGYSSAIVLGITKTPDALRAVQQAAEEKGEPLTKWESVKTVWKYYIPCAASAACATICLVSSTRMSNKKLAALTTACQLTESNLHDLKEATKKVAGEKKAAEISEAAAASKVSQKAPADDEIIHTCYGNDIFYDPWCGRFFTCSKDRIERAVAIVNNRVTEEDEDILNHFYYEIGLDVTLIGNNLGWTTRRGEKLYMSYGYGPTKDGRACAVLNYDVFVINGNRRLYGSDMVQ